MELKRQSQLSARIHLALLHDYGCNYLLFLLLRFPRSAEWSLTNCKTKEGKVPSRTAMKSIVLVYFSPYPVGPEWI